MSNSLPTPMKQSQLETGNIQFQELVGALYNTTSVLSRINTVEKLKYFFLHKNSDIFSEFWEMSK